MDPLEQYDSPYVYVNNNPIGNNDPTGMWGESGTNDITKTVVTPDSKIIYHDDSPDKKIYISWDGIKGSDGNTEGLEAVGTEDPNVDYSKGRYWNGLYQGQSNTTGYMPVWFNDGPIEEDYWLESLLLPGIPFGKLIMNKWVQKGIIKLLPKNISLLKQARHILGHEGFIKGRSILTKDAQKLLDKVRNGEVKGLSKINSQKVRVDFGEVIGNYIDPSTGNVLPTTNGIIHIAKDGAHIIPSRPN